MLPAPLKDRVRIAVLSVLAYIWRRLLVRTTFIAVTGSVGKTTAKECLVAILSASASTAGTRYNENDAPGVPRTILRVRPWNRFAVVEVGTDRPGRMRTSARLVKPDIAIVLALARTHTQAFRSIEETAADKAELVRRLPARGLAILNAEDPRVLAMARVSRAPIRTFGLSAGHDVWADEVSSEWPGRLRLRVHAGPATAQVQTNLVGRHWLNSVLAALTAAVSCGVDLGEASRALKRVQPFPGRMQPVRLPSGAILIRDEYNASPPTLGAALDTFATFHANRKILVVGPYSDAPETSRRRLRSLGRRAAMVADLVVFISKEHGRGAVKEALAAGMDPECARSFADLRSAADYLRAELRPGDLVLVKGRTTDHLSRMVFAQFGPIGCWTAVCHRRIICDFCPELRPPVNPLPAVLAPA